MIDRRRPLLERYLKKTRIYKGLVKESAFPEPEMKSCKLDAIIPRAVQEHWVAMGNPALPEATYSPSDGRGAYPERFQALRDDPRWPDLRSILRSYISRCIIAPFATQGAFWSLSCRTSSHNNPGPFVRINIYNHEVFVVGYTGNGGIFCYFHARKTSILPKTIANLERDFTDRKIIIIEQFEGQSRLYKESGDDQIRIQLLDLPRNNIVRIIETSDIIDSMRAISLDLQRKGRTPYMKYHNFHAMDDIFRSAEMRSKKYIKTDALSEFQQKLLQFTSGTEETRETRQRIGQDVFRKYLMLYWDGRCAISGIDEAKLLRASHIKPWSECATDAERLTPFNGFLFAAHVDAAFDAGLISFSDTGALLLSPSLSQSNFKALGIAVDARLELEDEHRAFLRFHRERFGFGPD